MDKKGMENMRLLGEGNYLNVFALIWLPASSETISMAGGLFQDSRQFNSQPMLQPSACSRIEMKRR